MCSPTVFSKAKIIFSKTLWVLAVIGIAIKPLTAADGNRKGYFFGLGLGLGMSSYAIKSTESYISIGKDSGTAQTVFFVDNGKSQDVPVLTADLRLGYAPAERLEIYFDLKATSIPSPHAGVFFDIDIDTHTIAALAATYYFKDSNPSMFIGGGIGISAYQDSGKDKALRAAVFARLGYAFSRHFAVGIDMMYEAPQSKEYFDDYTDWYGNHIIDRLVVRDYKIYSIAVCLMYTAY